MHKKGLVIMLGLPNGASATQEMDQGYKAIKQECKKRTDRVAAMKFTMHVQACKMAQAKKDSTGHYEESLFQPRQTFSDLDEIV